MATTTVTETTFEQRIQAFTEESVRAEFEIYPLPEDDSRPSSNSSAGEDRDLFDGHDQEQIRLMDEMCIVLDWNDKPLGAASKKVCKYIYEE